MAMELDTEWDTQRDTLEDMEVTLDTERSDTPEVIPDMEVMDTEVMEKVVWDMDTSCIKVGQSAVE